ncbi:unnamed protein product [Calicophoron daubneyi]|uniref:Uncharacterized protein n=1 Tax=Calicophoron daubneyi TaxID=300641 RepID=A0AAV2T1W0_CALDB
MYMIPLLLSLAILRKPAEAKYDVRKLTEGEEIRPQLETLLQVQIVFRHGDRSPVKDIRFVGYPSVKTLWPSGLGLLTSSGIQHAAELGKWVRAQYGPLISKDYNASNVYVRSSKKNRTIMSAQAFLTGLYQQPLSTLHTYSAVVDSRAVGAENELRPTKCMKKDIMQMELLHSDRVRFLFNRHRSVIKLLEEVTNKSSISAETVQSVADTLVCVKNSNFLMPQWCTDRIFKKIMKIRRYLWKLKYLSSNKILRLNAGVFFKRLTDTFKMTALHDILDRPRRFPHLVVYSGHDRNIDQLRAALGVYDNQIPDYSAALVLELHAPEKGRGIKGGYRVQFRYKRGWRDDRGYYFQIPPCVNIPVRAGCRLRYLIGKLKPVSINPADYMTGCRSLGSFVKQSKTLVTILAIASVFTSFL